MSQHTPTPWRWECDSFNDGSTTTCLSGPDGEPVLSSNSRHFGSLAPTPANAEFIVRAVNCHEELLEALRVADVLLLLGEHNGCSGHRQIQAAIAKAEQPNTTEPATGGG